MNSFSNILILGILIISIFSIFSTTMISFDHNEHMYVTAGVLLSKNYNIYSDFSFLQTPYLPILYCYIFRIMNINSFYLLTSKFVSFIFYIICTITIYLISSRLIKNIFKSICITTLFTLNSTIIASSTESSNYIMPITLTIMSLYLYICSFNINNIHYCGIFFSGILLGLAIGTKINYLIISVCLIISIPISFIYNNIQIKSKIFFKSILIFCSGLLLSLLPLLLFFIKDPKVFIFNNFEYHFINTEWRILSGYPKAMSFYSKLIFSKDILLLIENKIAYSAILIGILFKYYNKHYFVNKNYRFSEYKYIFIIFFIVSFTSIFIHTPLFNQYFSLPLLFLYLTIIGIFSDLENNNIYLKFCNFKIELKSLLLFILVVIVFSYSISNILYSTHKLLYRKNWVGLHFHDVSQRIRSILTENQIDFRHKVASLSPLFAIESDMPVYLEFSTGPFLYRIGDLVDNNHHDLFIATSPTYLNELFDSSPPSAIIIGFEGDLDIPFANYAIRNNYMEILIDGFDGVLYIKPD